jgi:GlpG protein
LLIVACVIVAIYTKWGDDHEAMRPFFISDPGFASGRTLPEVASGQFWRLISPIFLHMNVAHLLFNMMAFYQLGCMIEARRSTFTLFLLIVVTGILSNLAQFYVTGHPAFGGMSGVVYGLAGYIWIRGKCDPASGLFLDRQSVIYLLVWLVICYVGWVGRVANMAHLAGLIVGMIWGRVSALFAAHEK